VSNCTLTIAGEEDEVLRAAVMHAVDVHAHQDTPEFRERLRSALKPEREYERGTERGAESSAEPARH
jgi:predicted small metal-binding protein